MSKKAPIRGPSDLLHTTRAEQKRAVRSKSWDETLSELRRPTPAALHVRHVSYIEVDPASVRRGDSGRIAACLCGWRGPERSTIELAADDAIQHEKAGR